MQAVVLLFVSLSVLVIFSTTDAADEAIINEYYNYQPVHQARLMKDLLSNYHNEIPPTHEGPINLMLSLAMTSFEFIDEANFLASANAWIFYSWNDPRLRWDPKDYNGTKNIIINKDNVWLPDIELYNGVSVTEKTNTKVVIYSDGSISQVPVYLITFKCDMDLYIFPYDKQKCSMKFGSWHHHLDTINLTASEYTDLSYYKDSGDFTLVDIKSVRTEQQYDCCVEKYVDVTYYMSVERKTGAYGAKLVLPSVLTGFLVLATFLLPTGSHEKITLCAVLFLCLLLLMTYLHDIIPNSAATILGEYLAFALSIDFIATVIAVLAYKLNAQSGALSSGGMKAGPPIVNNVELQGDDNDLRIQMPQNRSKAWLRYLDIACFILFSIVFVIGSAILLGRR